MFSVEYFSEIKSAFDRQMALLEERSRLLEKEEGQAGLRSGLVRGLLLDKKKEIEGTLAGCGEDEAQALTFLYSAMPFSDLVDYPASLFLAYARHGVFLWNQGSFAGRVPEKLFANYVLHYRVNNEDIADTRGFFFDKLKETVESAGCVSMYDMAKEVNYWCAREATYRSTDMRTQSPRTIFGVAMGRCGEESTFAVTALRSIGIPARQIYAPLWSHCDDNHAWAEVWCDGSWHFLGACEPEERLDRGWFVDPASRAMLLHSRWFGKDEPEDEKVGPRGMAKVLNHLNRYARTRRLTVRVEDEKGQPVPGARVNFQVPNHGEFGSIALVYTGDGEKDCGMVQIMTGLGDLYISACAQAAGGNTATGDGWLYGENMAVYEDRQADGDAECTVVVKAGPECFEGWRDFDFHAPGPGRFHDEALTPRQQETGALRLSQAAEYRQKKAAGFYDAREAERVLGRFAGEDRELLDALLHQAHGNMGELVRFLEWDAAGRVRPDWQTGGTERWKLEVLKSIREKDCWDIKAETLIDCCINALPYAGSVPDEIFFRFLACPRVSNEMLRPCRNVLAECVDGDTKERIRRQPGVLPGMADRWIMSMPGQEYEGLITSPIGCLRGGVGSRHSREVFCVNLYRSLGIPARLNHIDGRLEYYHEGRFTAADGKNGGCTLILREDGILKLDDMEHYSLERFEGDGYVRLGLWGMARQGDGGTMELDVRPGIYRVVTLNRRKNGDQLVRMAVFTLRENERREVTLSMREIPAEGMLTKVAVEDFALQSQDGPKPLSVLTEGGKALFLWLEVTREPTEHILNELYERKEDFGRLETPLYVVLKTRNDLGDATLKRTMEALPSIRTLYDGFGENYEALAQSVGQEPGKLPLALVLNGEQECIYSDAGYNVGMADMLWKVLGSE